METNESQKVVLKNNLVQAVKTCGKLKVGSHLLNSSFTITNLSLLDFTENKFEDGEHAYEMDANVELKSKDGNSIQNHCKIHFCAQIKGTDVEIEHGMIIADGFSVPYGWEF